MDENRKDLLLTLLALGVQSTEACSDYFKRQKELLELLTPDRKAMVNSFYNRGYFVASGEAWDQFCVEFDDHLDYDLAMDDWLELYQQDGAFRKMLMEMQPADLIKDAFAFIDAFEG